MPLCHVHLHIQTSSPTCAGVCVQACVCTRLPIPCTHFLSASVLKTSWQLGFVPARPWARLPLHTYCVCVQIHAAFLPYQLSAQGPAGHMMSGQQLCAHGCCE